jgi:hypothetical protein
MQVARAWQQPKRAVSGGATAPKTPPASKEPQQKLEGERMSGLVPLKKGQEFPGPTASRTRLVTLDLGNGQTIRGYRISDTLFIDKSGKKYELAKETKAKK